MTDIVGNTTPPYNTQSEFLKFTPEGGLAIKVINDTGAASIKGMIVHASLSVDNAVSIIPIDNPDPCGIIYDNGIPNGEYIWIVIQGKAEVLYSTTVTRGTFSRVPQSLDAAPVAGQAINEALPVPPFSSDKHFQEIGHPIESRGTPGLAMTIIHFN